MDDVLEVEADPKPPTQASLGACVQSGTYLLELSLDWIVRRASENIYSLLGESHVTLIGEPLGNFVHGQALHDLRNLFSRLSGTTGIGRAYAIRLTDDPDLFDVAFQLSNGRVLLEAIPSSGSFGEAFGTVGGLIAGLTESHGQALLDSAARRMRALTGYDRVTLLCGSERAESSRGAFISSSAQSGDLPALIADTSASTVPIFPRGEDGSIGDALFRCPNQETIGALTDNGIHAVMCVAFAVDGLEGEFRCESRTPRKPNFELHAAAELFAQLFAMRLEIDRLKG
jgi:light-regulated signal transduction histidine kinase (bacteriophytochrome)